VTDCAIARTAENDTFVNSVQSRGSHYKTVPAWGRSLSKEIEMAERRFFTDCTEDFFASVRLIVLQA